MFRKCRMESTMIVLLILGLFAPAGCQGTRFVISNEPAHRESHEVEKEGPPPWAPAHGYRAKHKYRYYPSHHVYHDRERGLYFYYEYGRWEVSVSLPSGMHLDFDPYVTLEMDTGRPYEYDDEVVKRYPPGQLKKEKKKKKWK